MLKKKMLFVAPFPPHGGGIASYSAHALTHLEKRIPISAVGFRRVFPGNLFQRRESEQTDDVRKPVTGYLPWTWWYRSSWTEGSPPSSLLMPSWTVWLVPCMGTLLHSFKVRHPDVPAVLWCHNVAGHGEWPVLSGVYRYLYRRDLFFITHSEQETRKLQEFGIDSERIMTSFLPLHPVRPICSRSEARKKLNIHEDRHLLFFGAIRKYKGLDTLSRAWKALPAGWKSGTRLTVAGEVWPSMNPVLQELRKEGARIKRGYQTAEQTALLFSSADALVLPYKQSTASGILMMALSMGKPVIISRLPSLHPYLTPGAGMTTFQAGDAFGLTEAILSMFEDRDLSERGRDIMTWREQFSWERWCVEFLNFLRVACMLSS